MFEKIFAAIHDTTRFLNKNLCFDNASCIIREPSYEWKWFKKLSPTTQYRIRVLSGFFVMILNLVVWLAIIVTFFYLCSLYGNYTHAQNMEKIKRSEFNDLYNEYTHAQNMRKVKKGIFSDLYNNHPYSKNIKIIKIGRFND